MSAIVVDIDPNSGFCFGVVNAINKAENRLKTDGNLLSLGNIVHNKAEVNRLINLGLQVVTDDEFAGLKNQNILFRAHGEPPIKYEQAKQNNLNLIDATCPVVLKLQQRIRNAYEMATAVNGQVVIYGKKGHAEVNGLLGQTNNQAIVIQNIADIKQIDGEKPVWLFAQTTQSIEGFEQVAEHIKHHVNKTVKVHDTICRQVANRAPKLKEFVKHYQVVLFVSGADSSNGKYLYQICKQANRQSYFVSSVNDIDPNWLKGYSQFGICGATSTPQWQMDEVAEYIRDAFSL